jgi:hypothetical protein
VSVSGFKGTLPATTLTETSAKVAEASITLTATARVDLSAAITIEAGRLPNGATCVAKMEGTEISEPVTALETASAANAPQVVDLGLVGSTVFEGSGKETLASGTHTAEIWCKKIKPAETTTAETVKSASILLSATQ